MVQVGALMVHVQPSYTEEILPYRFPVEHKCFVHPDGSRLDIMSEDLAAAESAFTSEAYATQCVEHVAAAAERNKTYFKLRSNTTADTIVTTILDRYVNFHLGPSPVIVMAFMLVENHKAYTIQIQCQSDEYKGRLGDILACAQSARLLTGDLRPAGRGCNVLTYRVDAGPQYKVRIPVDFIVTTPVEGELHLQYRFDSLKTWKGIVTNSQKSPNKDEDEKQCMELPGGKLFLFIYFDVKELSPAIKSEVDHLLASITVTPEETLSSVLHYYESDELCIPLPNLAAYVVNVCEHANDTFVTLFMEEGSTGALFEMELHTVVIAEEQMEKFILYVETLFLTAAKPSIVKNASGQDRISTEGMAAIEEEMMLVLDAVRLSGEHWLVVRWTYAGCDPLPRPLEQYRDHLLEGVVVNK
ncbi:hypothetical protein AGDE_08203 [Angomonas deanei]|uniref:Uncharacterized protein n=1 Tax=Angomonas deanei TaxID=59799 RepID=A0A7G2C164_9TRYP|nr:hypothetical protein AGDE_08203 [Angomonas deanei]CAD2213275.1 hypothetical protein, conserved [Angomonas deanei]|eukprot:EPY33599.1 hypothetical protein AGDE_08203 [Angomonas deanei]